jgi:hypothetical protein
MDNDDDTLDAALAAFSELFEASELAWIEMLYEKADWLAFIAEPQWPPEK